MNMLCRNMNMLDCRRNQREPNVLQTAVVTHLRHITRTFSPRLSRAAMSADLALVIARTSLSSHWAVAPSHYKATFYPNRNNQGES